MDDTIDILKQLLEWRSNGEDVALATVINTWGSAPRRTGSTMCINSKMEFQGSVSGGCVETAVIEQALNVIKSRQNKLLEFGVSHEQAFEVGLACGGTIEIFLQAITNQQAQQIAVLIELSAKNESAALIVELEEKSQIDLITRNQIQDYSLFSDAESELLIKSLQQDRALVLEKNQSRYFVHPFNPQLNLYIIGAVHISQQLVQVLSPLGIKMSVIDPRSAFATKERFPDVELICQWPQQVFEDLTLNHRSAMVTLTHDPKFDDQALIAALNSDAFYIGALGSRKTHASRISRLANEGFDENQLSRIHAPIGMDINASNPAEIAVSIAAEIVQQLRKND